MAASSFYELPRLLILMGTAFLVSLETDLTNAASTVTKDYCEGETFRGRCSYDEVISIDSATYGRMQLDRCVQVNMGYVGCQANVLDIADGKCSGRRSCDVTIPDPEFERRRPCLELKSYLLVSYHCAKVLTPDSNDCRVARSLSSSSRHPPSQPSSGQLASIVAAETGCGSPDRPWIVEVPYGQQINLTLVDFTTTRRQGSPSPTDGTGTGTGAGAGAGGRVAAAAAAAGCVRYASVVERSADGKREERVDVCGRQGRERRVYSSRGHVVRVIMDVTQAAENPNYFLIGYQALGCPDPVLPEDQYFIRADDGDLVIGCRHSPDRWRLTCRHDNQWQGEVTVNCTSGNVLSSEVIDSPEKEKSPNAVLVAVLCIMLILLVLLTALIAVLLYKRRRRRRRLSRPPFSEERHQTTVKETKPDSESVTYTADEPDDDNDDVTKSRKNQRYGRHVTRHSSDQNSRRHHDHHHHRHHVYDSPIVTKNEDRGERGSEYEKVETCQTIGHFSSHIWNTPLPKVPGQS